MRIEPANVDQILCARDGRMVQIHEDAGNVAADLKQIDPHLKVRFAEAGNPPFWAVYHESDDGRSTHLVLTAQAHQSNTGAWTGLDQRIVKRVMEIGHSDYDYAAEIEKANQQVTADRRRTFRERVGEQAEQAAHALRKDLGAKYKGRIFKP
jgi:hypothetical protein